MKLLSFYALGLISIFTLLTAMDKQDSKIPYSTFLIDVQSWSLCIPAPVQNAESQTRTSQPTPGMLQVLHDEISKKGQPNK